MKNTTKKTKPLPSRMDTTLSSRTNVRDLVLDLVSDLVFDFDFNPPLELTEERRVREGLSARMSEPMVFIGEFRSGLTEHS